MKYKVTVPPTMEQGSYSTVVSDSYMMSAAQEALWDYNHARDHDGLPPLRRMPRGTTYTPIREGLKPCCKNPNKNVTVIKMRR